MMTGKDDQAVLCESATIMRAGAEPQCAPSPAADPKACSAANPTSVSASTTRRSAPRRGVAVNTLGPVIETDDARWPSPEPEQPRTGSRRDPPAQFVA